MNPLNDTTQQPNTIPTPNVAIKTDTHDSNESHPHTLELLAEKAQVELSRLAVGKLQARKEIRTTTVQIPVTLTQEVLVIEHIPHAQMATALPKEFVNNGDTVQHQSAWVNIERSARVPQAKVLINGQSHDITTTPVEIVLSQEFANVQIQTHVAETVNVTTTTDTQTQTIPVELRHEELVTETVNFDTPQVIAREVLPDTVLTQSQTMTTPKS